MSAQFPASSWDSHFLELFNKCLTKFNSGNTDFTTYYSQEDLEFLKSIGYREREFFDFIEDYGGGAELPPSTALLVASVRRDYFYVIQKGKPSDHIVSTGDLPAKTDEIDGIVWLPRIIVKARAKLKGEMNPDLMFACGGDRRFLKEYDIHPADFLRIVWAADTAENERIILEYVKGRRPLA